MRQVSEYIGMHLYTVCINFCKSMLLHVKPCVPYCMLLYVHLQFCNDVLGTTFTFELMDNHVAGLYIVVYSLVKVL